jgi:hypothetical protein
MVNFREQTIWGKSNLGYEGEGDLLPDPRNPTELMRQRTL